MIKILDKMSSRKLKLVTIMSSEMRYFSVKELSDQLNVSNKTLVRTVELLKEDLAEWDSQAEILEKNILGFSLNQSEGFSIKEVEIYYFKNSIIYQIIDELFNETFVDIKTFASKRYLSYTVVYTNIVAVKDILNDFEIKLKLSKNIQLDGTEMQIRYFYFSFYWNIYGGIEWPFEQVDKKEVYECIPIFEAFYSYTLSVSEVEFFLYWLGIIFTRTYFKNDKVECSDFHQYIGVYVELEEQLTSKLKNTSISEENIEEEILFLYLILFSFQPKRSYDPLNQIQVQMKMKVNKEAEHVLSNEWIKVFNSFFSLNLTISEQIVLYTNLVISHFRMRVFRGGAIFFKEYRYYLMINEEKNENKLEQIADQIIFDLSNMKEFQPLLRDKEMLSFLYKQELCELLFSDYRMGNIKVAVVSQFGKQVNQYFKNIIQSKTILTIQFCSFTEDDVDVIISDRYYSEVNQKRNSNAELVIWNDKPSEIDKHKVSEVVKKIIEEKQNNIFSRMLTGFLGNTEQQYQVE